MISPGELQAGQYITVHSWKPMEVTRFPSLFEMMSGEPSGDTATRTHIDRSWCGDVLKVEALALPYITAKVLSRYASSISDVVKLDTRRVELMELSKEFVNSALNRQEIA